MALAAVPGAPAPDPRASEEPRDLRELYLAAKRDLEAPTAAAHLRWIFWHARAVGRLEIARQEQRNVELRDHEAFVRAMAAIPSEHAVAHWTKQRPHETEIGLAKEAVLERVQFVEVAARICALLDGMWGRAQQNGGAR